MRYRMTIISLMSILGLAGVRINTAHAICMPSDPDCPPPRPPPARTCADSPPLVADLFTVQCKAADNSRCGDNITTGLCHDLNVEVFGANAINLQAFNWLEANGKCAIAYPDGSGYRLQGVCRPGCFAEDTQISIEPHSDPGVLPRPAMPGSSIEAVESAGKLTTATRLMSLGDKASIDRVSLIPRPIDVPTHGPEKPDLFVFSLSNGRRLRVTNAHPMVLADGSVIRANRVQPKAVFIGGDGRPVDVLAITREPATGDVYGFETRSDTRLGHIIVAEGVLVGDLKIQDDEQAELTGLEARR
jgi:hypothetical protein